MQKRTTSHWSLMAAAVLAIALLWPPPGVAQTVTGHARAVQASVASPQGLVTSTLADTGTLGGSTDARSASQISGSIPALLSAETLHAATIGWIDQVASEASMGRLSITIAGTTISADFVQARATSVAGAAGHRASSVTGLTINGAAVAVSGEPNESITIPGGVVVVNEQASSGSTIVVNALHIVIDGAADLVIASARASAQ